MTNYGIRLQSVMLGILLASAACGRKIAPAERIDPELVRYVPPETAAIAGVQLGALRDTPLYARNRNQLANLIPPRAGNESLLVWNGKTLLVAEKSVSSERVKLSGDPAAVRRAQLAAKNGTGQLPNELAAAGAWLPASDQLWILIRGLPLEGVPLSSQYSSLLANFRGHIRRSAIGIHADSGLTLRARIECFSEQGSRRVEVALRAGIGFERLSTGDRDPIESRMYDALRVTRDGASVYVDGKFPPELSDELLRRAVRQAER